MKVFLFVAVQQAEVTARLIRAASRTSATVVLDLEDTLWDVTDEARTSALKAAGREDLVTLARTRPDLFERHAIGVRVNRISGPEAERDFDALGRASRFVEFECVIPTKVETAGDLLECASVLQRRWVACRGIVPIVETRRGLANLDEILAEAGRAGIEWLVYGHYDFALDSGWWPFPEHHEPAFWEHVEPMIRRIEAAGLGYVHPPYFETHDGVGFAGIVERLRSACAREFGVITVGLRQTALADRLGNPAALPMDEPEDRLTTPTEQETPLALARRVTEGYLATKRPDASFALDPRTGRFISPHVYLAARRHLREAGDE